MHIRYGYRIDVLCESPIPLTTMLDVHPSRRADVTMADAMVARSIANPRNVVASTQSLDAFGNLCRRLLVPAGGVALKARGIIHHSGFPEDRDPAADAIPRDQLSPMFLPYIAASRYCETDPLADAAGRLFGSIPGGWAKVVEICRFVSQHVRFHAKLSDAARTAFDVFQDETGIDRDYTHLAIALCRCLDIPARYCSGYPPDIGVDPEDKAVGFSSWFEAYLGDRWWTFDPRHATPRIGHILIAQGRDADDVPFIYSSGSYVLGQFRVLADEVNGARFPVSSSARREHSALYSRLNASGR